MLNRKNENKQIFNGVRRRSLEGAHSMNKFWSNVLCFLGVHDRRWSIVQTKQIGVFENEADKMPIRTMYSIVQNGVCQRCGHIKLDVQQKRL